MKFRFEHDSLWRQPWFVAAYAALAAIAFMPGFADLFRWAWASRKFRDYVNFMAVLAVGIITIVIVHTFVVAADRALRRKLRLPASWFGPSPFLIAGFVMLALMMILFITIVLAGYVPQSIAVFDHITGADRDPFLDIDFTDYLMISTTFFAPIVGLIGIGWQTRSQLNEYRKSALRSEAKRRLGMLTMLSQEVGIICRKAATIAKLYERGFFHEARGVARRHYLRNEPASIMHIGVSAYPALAAEVGSIENVQLIRDLMQFYDQVDQLKMFCQDTSDAGIHLVGRGRWQHWFAKKALEVGEKVRAQMNREIDTEKKYLDRISTRYGTKINRPNMPHQ